MSKVEGEKLMAYVSDEMLNETLLQYSTASIGDTQNFEVEDHEINISVAEHKVRQREEVGVQNEAARIVEVIVNVEGMDLTKTKEGTRYVNSEERLVLKRSRLRENYETKVHDDIPSIKNVDWKRTKREAGHVNNVTANVKRNSESED